MKVKLSVAGGAVESGVRRVVWAGPGVLATATGESLVRFWNLAADENYVLSLGAALGQRLALLELLFRVALGRGGLLLLLALFRGDPRLALPLELLLAR